MWKERNLFLYLCVICSWHTILYESWTKCLIDFTYAIGRVYIFWNLFRYTRLFRHMISALYKEANLQVKLFIHLLYSRLRKVREIKREIFRPISVSLIFLYAIKSLTILASPQNVMFAWKLFFPISKNHQHIQTELFSFT